MIRTEMLLEAAGGPSAISQQAPVPLIAECALLRRKRTAELANRIPSLSRSSPWPRDREPRCARRSDDTDARSGFDSTADRSVPDAIKSGKDREALGHAKFPEAYM
jgi:hypothetical protein